MLRIYAFLLLFVCATASICQATPVQWSVSDGGNGHYYEVVAVPERITWSDAQSLCISRGGYLATVTSAEENAFLFNIAKDVDDAWFSVPAYNSTLGPWLGGYQDDNAVANDTGWNWVTGEAWNYTAWATGQPDSIDEFALHYYGWNVTKNSTWNDVSGNTPLWGYCIEFDAVPEPSSILSLTGFCGFGMLEIRRRM